MAFAPFKANPPLVIDPDTVLSFAVTFELFKAIARRYPQVFKGLRRFYPFQFAPCNTLNISSPPPDILSLK